MTFLFLRKAHISIYLTYFFQLLATILDPTTTALQRALWRELLNIEPRAVNPGDENRQNRHTAYRCYILWQYNRLGAGVRRVIPSCVVLKIMSTFPDPFGQYTGFRRDRLAGNIHDTCIHI